MLVIQVFIMRNGAFEGTEMVTGDRIEIGRDPNCALLLDDESCSRRHAAIFEQAGTLMVQDQGSANGTRLNGELFTGVRPLGPRDDLVIGAYTLKFKVMSGIGRAPPPPPPPMPVAGVNDPTRLHPKQTPGVPGNPLLPPLLSSSPPGPLASVPAPPTAPGARPPASGGGPLSHKNPLSVPASHDAAETAVHERPAIVPGPKLPEAGPTELMNELRDDDKTVTYARNSMPSMPPASDESPDTAPQRMPSRPPPPPMGDASGEGDVTAPDRLAPPKKRPSADTNNLPLPMAAAGVGGASIAPMEVPNVSVPAITFAPAFLDEELIDHDADDPPWSLVQRLVRPTVDRQKNALIEFVHYRGETVVGHGVVREGETFRLGADMSKSERAERGLPKPVPLVHLKKGGVAEVFLRDGVAGKVLRGGQQEDLGASLGPSSGKGQQAVPITDGELASLKLGNERVFVRFASAPQMLWTRDDAAEDLFARRLNLIAGGASFGLFALMLLVSWVYQYRNADEEVFALDDEGFAEVELKDLKMEEPPPEEKPVEPIQAPDPTQVAPPKPQSLKSDTKPEPNQPAPKPGVMDILANIPKVQDSASSQNLNAALSNIKGVRVPGATSGFKTSALVGKGPSSGVQIGGAAGGLSTSGINSVLREGSAGALGGKETRAVSGKVTTLSRQFQKQGQGELSKEEVMRVINANIGKIQYCYEKALRTQPGLAGRVVLEWTVNTSGKVTVVKVASSSMNSTDATRCMMDSLRGWKFPQPKGGNVTIVFPFVFNTL